MRRREFIAGIGVTTAWPLAARAQQAGKVHRVALVFTTSQPAEMAGPEPLHPSARAFVQRLRALGYNEGQNLVLERRSAEGRLETLSDIVADIVSHQTDVVVAVGHPSIIPAVKAARSLPTILVPSYFDPVEAGLVETLARPGKNVTGLSITPTPEIEAKRLELLKTILPSSKRIAFLGMRDDWEDSYGKSVQAAAKELSVDLAPAQHTPNDYAGAFQRIGGQRFDAILVANTPVEFANRQLIVDFATRSRLPGMFSRREYVQAGGLMSYGVDITDLFRRAADFVDKILRGAKPADLPVEQPTKFELVINLKTARALGIDIPPMLLARADEVIE